jgi:hypothetical protein
MPLKQREIGLHKKSVNGNRKNSLLGVGCENFASLPWGKHPDNTAFSPVPGALSTIFTYSFMLK